MADTLTIGGVDRSSAIAWDSLKIEQTAGAYTAVASVILNDPNSSLSVAAKQVVTVADGIETLFAGEVADQTWQLLDISHDGRRLGLKCQDYNILVSEAVIDTEEVYSATADDAIIADLFSTYRADIDASTYVAQLDASMDLTFEHVTLREALDEICKRTGGYWYVDETKKLHYFSSESNTLAWYLTDNAPDLGTTFPYQHIERVSRGGTIVNQVLVVGSGGVSEWVEDTGSVYAYGERQAVIVDSKITSSAEAQDRGAAILQDWSDPKVQYKVTTRKSGARAGMDLRIVCTAWGIDETLTIRRLTIRWAGDQRFYDLELGAPVTTSGGGGHTITDRIKRVEIDTGDLGDTVFDDDAPAAPSFVIGNLSTGVVEDADGHQLIYIRATWGIVTDGDLDHYEIQCADNSAFNWPMVQHVQAGDTREVIFQGLQGNVAHYLRVRAVDWVGNYSAWSPQPTGYLTITAAADTTAPSDPTGLSVSGAPTTIHVIWDQNAEADLSHYVLERAQDSGGAPGAWVEVYTGDARFYIDDTLTEAQILNGTSFWFRVKAVDFSTNASGYATSGSATAAGQLQNGHFASDVITARLVGANEIIANTANIKSALIVNGHIAAGTIEADRMNVSSLSAITANMGTLTAGEIRVGTGTVGVNFTGFRIMSTYMAGYNTDVVQAGIRSSDGYFVFGGGSGYCNASGISIVVTTAYGSTRAYRFVDGSANYLGGMNAYDQASGVALQVFTMQPTGKSGQIFIDSNAPSGYISAVNIIAYQASAANYCILSVAVTAAGVERIDLESDTLYKTITPGGTAYEVGLPHWLTTGIGSASFNGDSFSTTSKTLIDLSATFSGVPGGIKAVRMRAAVRDSASAGGECYLILSPNNTANSGIYIRCSGLANDRYSDQFVWVPCDSNGDIYYQIVASGSLTMDIWLEVWGYEV